MHGMREEQIESSGSDSTESGLFVDGAFVGHHRGHRKHKRRRALAAAKTGAFVGAFVGHHGGIRVPKNRVITAAQFMALATILAQRIAGRGKTPTANQVNTAQTIIRKKLAAVHSSVAGGEPVETMNAIKGRLLGNQMAGSGPSDSGAFWDRVKSIAKSSLPSVLPAAAVAFPVAALTAAAVTKSQQHSARKGTPAAAPAPAEAPAPAAAPAEGSSNESSVQKVSGYDSSEDLKTNQQQQLIRIIRKAESGDKTSRTAVLTPGFADEISNVFGPDMASMFKRALLGDQAARAGFKQQALAIEKKPRKKTKEETTSTTGWFGSSNNGFTAHPGDEGGTFKMSHKGAKNGSESFKLPSGWSVDEADHSNVKGDGVMGFLGFGSKTVVPYDYEKGYVILRHQGKKNSKPLVIPSGWSFKASDNTNTTVNGPAPKAKAAMSGDNTKTVPHDVYRAEICRRAKLLCKGGKPTAECMAKAQASVHNEMRKSGVKVSIPGAAPGRVTAGPSSSMMGKQKLDELTEIVGRQQKLDEMTEIIGHHQRLDEMTEIIDGKI